MPLARWINRFWKVGYTIRLESSVSKDTQLVLMTPGILLKKLARDPMLKEYTHVLIDEVRCLGILQYVDPEGGDDFRFVERVWLVELGPLSGYLTRPSFPPFSLANPNNATC